MWTKIKKEIHFQIRLNYKRTWTAEFTVANKSNKIIGHPKGEHKIAWGDIYSEVQGSIHLKLRKQLAFHIQVLYVCLTSSLCVFTSNKVIPMV